MPVEPPWTAPLTDGEHSLILFGIAAATLALSATLVRFRFTARESHGVYQTASLTANAVVAIAAGTYAAIIAAFLLGYHHQHGMWIPNATALFAWSFRYMDWVVTVPLLVVELLAVSNLAGANATRSRVGGIGLAIAMVVSGYLGAIVIDDGRNFTVIAVAGGIAALCFVGLYALVLLTLRRSVPRMPVSARSSYQSAINLLLVIWLVYPIVYGLQGVTTGGTWAVTGQVALCAADMIAKIGFGTYVHRTAVLRSRADEDVDPTAPRPRQPQADAVWVDQERTLDFDPY